MKQQLSNFLHRFTSFLSNEKVFTANIAVATTTALTSLTSLVANGHKLIAEDSVEVANKLNPWLTSALSDFSSSQIMEFASMNAAATVATMSLMAIGMALKKPAENAYRAFGDASISGVNDKVRALVTNGSAGSEVRAYISSALESDKELRRQYIRALDTDASRIKDITAFRDKYDNQQVDNDNNHQLSRG